MRMNLIAVHSNKGGVGKTTCVTHLAGVLAGVGMRVLVIDLDSQANAAVQLGLDHAAIRGRSIEALLEDPDLDAVASALPTPWSDDVRVIASDTSLRLLSKQIVADGQDSARPWLQEIVEEFGEPDSAWTPGVVLFDTPPSTYDPFVQAALELADTLIIPSGTQRHDIDAVLRAYEDARLLRQAIGKPEPAAGVILQMLRETTLTMMELEQYLSDEFPLPMLGWTALTERVREAAYTMADGESARPLTWQPERHASSRPATNVCWNYTEFAHRVISMANGVPVEPMPMPDFRQRATLAA